MSYSAKKGMIANDPITYLSCRACPRTRGRGCGHVAVGHGSHADFLHDGHAHVAHGDHYDECQPDAHTPAGVHSHKHGSDCGHPTVQHEAHVDYVHDQHRHASHADHYDEH